VLHIADETLYEWNAEIRNLYFHLDRSLHSMPQLYNTDGHPLEFHRLIYKISSADEAFEMAICADSLIKVTRSPLSSHRVPLLLRNGPGMLGGTYAR